MKKPTLSILITSYKNASLLRLCLESFKKNIKGIQYEMIVADSETSEEIENLMREGFPEVAFIPNKKNVGFGFLFNQLIKESKGEFLFIVNADIIIKDDSVLKLIELLKKDAKIGVAGPKLINFDNSIQPSSFRFYKISTVIYRRTFLGKMPWAKKELDKFLMKNAPQNKPIEVDWIMGSALMMRKTLIEKIGGMDKKFFMYFEDVDLCWRIWEAGFKVIHNPLVKVYHYHGKASANTGILKAVLFNKYSRIHIESAIKFFWKHKTMGYKLPYNK